jgi:hypothetical protein
MKKQNGEKALLVGSIKRNNASVNVDLPAPLLHYIKIGLNSFL